MLLIAACAINRYCGVRNNPVIACAITPLLQAWDTGEQLEVALDVLEETGSVLCVCLCVCVCVCVCARAPVSACVRAWVWPVRRF